MRRRIYKKNSHNYTKFEVWVQSNSIYKFENISITFSIPTIHTFISSHFIFFPSYMIFYRGFMFSRRADSILFLKGKRRLYGYVTLLSWTKKDISVGMNITEFFFYQILQIFFKNFYKLFGFWHLFVIIVIVIYFH